MLCYARVCAVVLVAVWGTVPVNKGSRTQKMLLYLGCQQTSKGLNKCYRILESRSKSAGTGRRLFCGGVLYATCIINFIVQDWQHNVFQQQ